MALKKSKLQEIPQRNKDLAFGYTRKCEKQHQSSIPAMIKYLCLVYLNQNKDKFDPDDISKNVTIDGNSINNHITDDVVSSTYLINIVCRGTHIWRFRCNRPSVGNVGDGINDMIGILTNDAERQTDGYFDDFPGEKGIGYGFATDGRLNEPKNALWGKCYGRVCGIDDIIEMKLDFNELTLSYKINEKCYGKAFDIEQNEYRAVVCMAGKNASWTLMYYQMFY